MDEQRFTSADLARLAMLEQLHQASELFRRKTAHWSNSFARSGSFSQEAASDHSAPEAALTCAVIAELLAGTPFTVIEPMLPPNRRRTEADYGKEVEEFLDGVMFPNREALGRRHGWFAGRDGLENLANTLARLDQWVGDPGVDNAVYRPPGEAGRYPVSSALHPGESSGTLAIMQVSLVSEAARKIIHQTLPPGVDYHVASRGFFAHKLRVAHLVVAHDPAPASNRTLLDDAQRQYDSIGQPAAALVDEIRRAGLSLAGQLDVPDYQAGLVASFVQVAQSPDASVATFIAATQRLATRFGYASDKPDPPAVAKAKKDLLQALSYSPAAQAGRIAELATSEVTMGAMEREAQQLRNRPERTAEPVSLTPQYSKTAIAALSVSMANQKASDFARRLCASAAKPNLPPGELTRRAALLVPLAEETLSSAVVMDRALRATWNEIAEAIGDSRTPGQIEARYSPEVDRFNELHLLSALTLPGHKLGGPAIPEEFRDPNSVATSLDNWYFGRGLQPGVETRRQRIHEAGPISSGFRSGPRELAADCAMVLARYQRQIQLNVLPPGVTRAGAEIALTHREDDLSEIVKLMRAPSEVSPESQRVVNAHPQLGLEFRPPGH